MQVIRDNCRSLQQYDWLKLVVAWLKPELGNCNFLLRNKLNNYVRGGLGGAKRLRDGEHGNG